MNLTNEKWYLEAAGKSMQQVEQELINRIKHGELEYLATLHKWLERWGVDKEYIEDTPIPGIMQQRIYFAGTDPAELRWLVERVP